MANVTIGNGRAQGTDVPSPHDPTAFGGGIDAANAAVTLDSVTFQGNQAVGEDTGNGAGGAAAGGALSIRGSGALSRLTNVTFVGNSSQGGRGPKQGGVAFGALFVFASTVEVEDSSFTSNHASAGSSTGDGQVDGQRADALGGAVAVEGGGNVSLVRVVATENDVTGGGATQYGGGGFGGAVYAENSTLSSADSLIQSNAARGAASASGGFAAGGGVLLFNSDGVIDRSRIIANRATGGNSAPGQFTGTGGGGGLYLWRSDLSVTIGTIPVTNTVIADDTVELGQGGINPGGGGGGLQVQGLSARPHARDVGRQSPGNRAGRRASHGDRRGQFSRECGSFVQRDSRPRGVERRRDGDRGRAGSSLALGPVALYRQYPRHQLRQHAVATRQHHGV